MTPRNVGPPCTRDVPAELALCVHLLQRLYAAPACQPEETFDLVTKVLKKCNQNADVVYLV